MPFADHPHVREQDLVPAPGREVWSFVDGLPMTPTGKTQKYVLRQQAADGALTFDEAWLLRSQGG